MCGNPDTSIEPTKQEKGAAQMSTELFNYYKKNYEPLITGFAEERTQPLVSEEEKRQVSGEIRAQVMKNVDVTKGSANPVETAKELGDVAGLESGAQVKGQAAERSRQLGTVENIIGIGRGQVLSAQQSMEQQAAQSVQQEEAQKQMELEKKIAKSQSQTSMVGSLI